MMFILIILFLIIKPNQSYEWNCTENKHFLFTNDQIYEQCTITIEYISSQHYKHICITNRLSIKTLPLPSFNSNYTMHTFKINSCQLLTLNQIPFLLPATVENLDLSYNLLSSFTLTFPLPSYLKYLRLDHNPNLIDIHFGSNHVQQRLIGLSLRYNKNLRLSSLPSYLKQLDLTDCNLLSSSLLLRSLTKLTHLSLADNQLKQLPQIDKRIQLEYLNLSNNSLTSIDNGWLHKSLKILDLTFNQIESIEFIHHVFKINQTAVKQNHRDLLINNPILQISLHGNPLRCDCWLGSLVNLSSMKIIDLSLLQCNSHPMMNQSDNNFLCSYTQHCALDCSCCDFEACDCHFVCPSECLCYHDTLWSNHIIQCQQRNLFDIHNHLPETITDLNYEENHIEELKSFVFVGKNNLSRLNLAKNNIKNLTNDTFCGAKNLREINLSYNKNLMIKFSSINELFSCLNYLTFIIISKEQIYDENEKFPNHEWSLESSNNNNNLIRLIRIQQNIFVLESSSIRNFYTVSTMSSISFPTKIFSFYQSESLLSSNFIQHNQILIIIVFFLILFLLLFLLLLILLAICRRKLRRHLKAELQRQRSQHYYYHTNIHPSTMKIPSNSNGPNDSLYEQLPSLSSDSEQPFLYSEKKSNNINVPILPPYPPTLRHYHCCHHTRNSHDYQYGRNSSISNLQPNLCPTVLVLGNQTCHPNHHEYTCELQQYLLTNQQDKNSTILRCNNETGFITTNICQCNLENLDSSTYPNVYK